MKTMTMRQFLNQEDISYDKENCYITDGNLLLVAEYTKLNWLDKFKINNIIKKIPPLEQIPFEKGERVYLRDDVIISSRNIQAYTVIAPVHANGKPKLFDKKYIDFVIKYIQPDSYTIVRHLGTKDNYLIKFWKDNVFLGVLGEIQIRGLND